MGQKIGLFILSSFCLFGLSAQQNNLIIKGTFYFSNPLPIPLYLAGTFSEPRLGHFHAGLDIKTNGKEGYPVLCVEDGYVSRIKVSETGYGNALYITHHNGIVSVYAHLQSFSPEISDFVKAAQYQKETFNIELFPGKNQFKFNKKDTIGFSGNSGSSSGPHLHFELRDAESERPINPLLFNINIVDSIAPIINGIKIYPINKNSYINKIHSAKILEAKKTKENNYTLVENNLVVHGDIGFSINTYDQMNNISNKNGIYYLELFVDSQSIYTYTADQFSFSDARYVHAHIDYEERVLNKQYYHRTFLLPGNQLSNYEGVINNGIYNFSDTLLHHILFKVTDIQNNTTSLGFHVQSLQDDIESNYSPIDSNFKAFFPYEQKNSFSNNDIQISFPSGSFYDDIYFQYHMTDDIPESQYSKTHYLHNTFTPIHKYFDISIKTEPIAPDLATKAIITYYDYDSTLLSCGGSYHDGWLKARSREFGIYKIVLDTIAPIINIQNKIEKDNVIKEDAIKVTIMDSLSGIKSYHPTIDGRWILMEYDPKNNLLTHIFDKTMAPGEHLFNLTVYDERKNKSVISLTFIK